MQRLITEDIPRRVAADEAYQNAQRNSDPKNARIEHNRALGRVMMDLLKDDTELFKQFSDNVSSSAGSPTPCSTRPTARAHNGTYAVARDRLRFAAALTDRGAVGNLSRGTFGA